MPTIPDMPLGAASDDAWRAYSTKLAQLWAGDRVRLVGRWESVVIQRAETADCLDRERQADRIR